MANRAGPSQTFPGQVRETAILIPHVPKPLSPWVLVCASARPPCSNPKYPPQVQARARLYPPPERRRGPRPSSPKPRPEEVDHPTKIATKRRWSHACNSLNASLANGRGAEGSVFQRLAGRVEEKRRLNPPRRAGACSPKESVLRAICDDAPCGIKSC